MSGPVAPGEIVTIFGKGLGPATIAYGDFSGPDQTLQTAVSGARILFDGFPAPVIYTLEGQASVIVPYDIANRTTTQVTAEYNGNTSAAVTLNVAPSSPGMFTVNQSGTGAGIVLQPRQHAELAHQSGKARRDHRDIRHRGRADGTSGSQR